MGGITDGTIFPVKYSPFSNFQLIFNVCIGSFDVKQKWVLQKTNAVGHMRTAYGAEGGCSPPQFVKMSSFSGKNLVLFGQWLCKLQFPNHGFICSLARQKYGDKGIRSSEILSAGFVCHSNHVCISISRWIYKNNLKTECYHALNLFK